MHSKLSRSGLIVILAVCLAIFASPVFAQSGTIVETEEELLNALASQDAMIEVSGDISLTETLVLDYEVTLAGANDEASLTFSDQVEVSGDLYSQTMIQVTGAEVTFSGLNLGMEENGATSETWFWSLVSVEDGAALTLASCMLYADEVHLAPSTLGAEITPPEEDYDREALNGVFVEDGSLTVTDTGFFEFSMAGILLGDGAHDISVTESGVEDSTVGILNLHGTADDYDADESTLTSLSVVGSDFSNNVFGIILLPNASSIDITGNTFDGDEGYDEELLAGVVVLPVGIADFPGLLREIDDGYVGPESVSLQAGSLLEDIPQLGYIHDLLTTYLVFPDEDSQVSDLAVQDGNVFNDTYVGTAFVGCHDDITVSNNMFDDNAVGAVVTGFPGTLLGELLDAIIDAMEGSMSNVSVSMVSASGERETVGVMKAAASSHSFPDYNADVTFEGNVFLDNAVGAAVALNASAQFGMPGEVFRPVSVQLLESAKDLGYGNAFDDNYCGILLANGPGDVTVQANYFYDNELAIGDVGYQMLFDAALGYLMMGSSATTTEDPLQELEDIFEEFEANSASTLLVEGNRFMLGEDEGIWLLNNRVSAVIRQNTFFKALGTESVVDPRMGMESSLSAAESFLGLGGSTAIRVGLSEVEGLTLDCVPARVSIVENDFFVEDFLIESSVSSAYSEPELEVPSSFVHFDLADASRGEFDLHLNRFDDLEYLYGDPNAYAVVNLGEDELDGTRNLWLQDLSDLDPDGMMFPDSDALTWQQAYQHVYGPLKVAPVLTDEALEYDEDFDEPTVSGDVVTYTGTAEGIDFEVDVASGDEAGLVLKPVTEEEARSAFTAEEQDGLGNIFYLPLDIRVDGPVQGPWTFRFENVQGFTNDNLVVKTTTARGVLTWEDNAYVSDDGQWVVLVVDDDTTPSFYDFTGSVTMTASSTGTSSGSGGGCQIGFAPVSALLLLLPLMGLKR